MKLKLILGKFYYYWNHKLNSQFQNDYYLKNKSYFYEETIFKLCLMILLPIFFSLIIVSPGYLLLTQTTIWFILFFIPIFNLNFIPLINHYLSGKIDPLFNFGLFLGSLILYLSVYFKFSPATSPLLSGIVVTIHGISFLIWRQLLHRGWIHQGFSKTNQYLESQWQKFLTKKTLQHQKKNIPKIINSHGKGL